MRVSVLAAAMLAGGVAGAESVRPFGYGSLERWREAPTLQPTLHAAGFEGEEVYVLRAGGVDATCPEEPPMINWQGAGTTVCPCFAVAEEAGAVFLAPSSHYPIEILRIGIGWGSQLGGQPDSLEDAIRIYPAGLPNPGLDPQFETLGPLLRDGFINEFDVSGLSGNRIIPSGRFTVTLAFGVANAGIFTAPSVVHDGNGCIPGRNVVRSVSFPGFWRDACSLGVSGDWVFQVVYRRVNCQAPCPGDTNGDRRVDFQDLNTVLSQFGQTGVGLAGDVSGDGVVNFVDLNIVLGAFGAVCA